MADASSGALQGRGRARSRTYSDSDHDFVSELHSATGAPPPPAPVVPEPAAPAGASRRAGLSEKTLQIVSDLSAAASLAPPKLGGADSDEEEAVGHARGGEPALGEAELAERELAAAERARKRAAEAGGGGGAGAPSGGGGGSGGGGRGVGGRARKAEQPFDVCVKLLLLGDANVGKTSLMLRFSEDSFSQDTSATLGVDYKTAYLDMDGFVVKCQIWDAAGQQRFHMITHTYYKQAQGIVLVYDSSEPTEASFKNVQYWMENIQKHASPNTRKMLLGNKCDVKGKRVEAARGQEVASAHAIKFFETSAKSGLNVKESFAALAREVVESMLANGALVHPGGTSTSGGGGGGSAAAAGGEKKKDCAVV